MIYTSGVISDINKMETLEELQDNKLNMVCEKLALKEGDRLLDIGCGWGTLVTHAAKNYGADVTGGELSVPAHNVLAHVSHSRQGADCLRYPAIARERCPRVSGPNPLQGLPRDSPREGLLQQDLLSRDGRTRWYQAIRNLP